MAITPQLASRYEPLFNSIISPDGRHVAVVKPTFDEQSGRKPTRLFMRRLDAPDWWQVGGGDYVLFHPAFSPDSTRLAALREAEDGVHVAVFDVRDPARPYRPHGGLPRNAGVLKWADGPPRILCLGYEGSTQRVWLLGGGGAMPITPADHHVRDYAVRGQRLAWICAPKDAHGPVLYRGDTEGGAFEAHPLPGAALGGLAFSRDGERLAYFASPSPGLPAHERLFVRDEHGSTCISESIDGRITGFDWMGDDVVLAVEQGSGSRLVRITPDGDTTWMGSHQRYVSGPSCDTDGTVLVHLSQSAHEPQRLVLREDDREQPLSDFNLPLEAADPQPDVEVHWEGADGVPLQGVLIRPPTDGPHPLVVWLHDGPDRAADHTFAPYFQVFVSQGMAVFAPNYRGSSGRDDAFLQASIGAPCTAELDDIERGLLSLDGIDLDRVALMGWHFGGTLALLLALRRDPVRYSAVIAGAPFVDWISTFGGLADPASLVRYFPTSWVEDRAPYDAVSPISHVGRYDVPTLLFQGRQDSVVPTGQTLLLYRALRERNVPADLVYYFGEGHVPQGPAAIEDMLARTLKWLDPSRLDE